MTDVTIENHGSLFLFRLHTRAAKMFVEENVIPSTQFFGGALAVEPRYVYDLAEGMVGDGLTVDGGGFGLDSITEVLQ
jgi:hypothetical protein